jgi:hypothetical protein
MLKSAGQMTQGYRYSRKIYMKTLLINTILILFTACSLLCIPACTPQETKIEIATCSLDQVIETAMVRSPECRLQLPVEKVKG